MVEGQTDRPVADEQVVNVLIKIPHSTARRSFAKQNVFRYFLSKKCGSVPRARTSGCIRMNSSTALVPPFFTPTISALGSFLFPYFCATLMFLNFTSAQWLPDEAGALLCSRTSLAPRRAADSSTAARTSSDAQLSNFPRSFFPPAFLPGEHLLPS
ncbi:hypothetical protein EYF80_010159 [Liparis tanakae]|uniref:Uncharacterized protein n=1 Tax=Liparis tanakae TaxID=230148 RepID=A0A4Z2IP54_9TELE|nr:hypothetical protein EYF80_010159 [Liparis tanakae]